MVDVRIDSVLDAKAQTLVNTVNCVGVMGKGIALEFKRRFPDMFKEYAAACKRGSVRLGEPYLFRGSTSPWILNFPTKRHWRDRSSQDDITAGLEYLEEHYRAWGIESLAVPPLGCGNGGLRWDVVGPILFDHLSRFEIPVELYAPPGTPPPELKPAFLRQAGMPIGDASRRPSRIDAAAVALAAVLAGIEEEPYHRPVSRRAFEQIAYFAAVAGLPTGLGHSLRGRGVSSQDLGALVNHLASDGVLLERQVGKTIMTETGSGYPRAAAAFKNQLPRWEALSQRAADLFLRTRSDREAELMASILFVAGDLCRCRKTNPSERDVLHELKRRKPRLWRGWEEGEIAVAIRDLAARRWLEVEPSCDLRLPEELAAEA